MEVGKHFKATSAAARFSTLEMRRLSFGNKYAKEPFAKELAKMTRSNFPVLEISAVNLPPMRAQ